MTGDANRCDENPTARGASPTATPKELSSLDVAFLCLEDSGTPMTIGGLVVFQPKCAVHPQRLVTILRDRAARIPHLRQRVRAQLSPLGGATWIEDENFNAGAHVTALRIPSPGGSDQMLAYAAEAMSVPLDMGRPPWEIHVITGRNDGSVAVLLKLHHALADGVTALKIGHGLLDQGCDRAYDNTGGQPVGRVREMAKLVSSAWDLATKPADLMHKAEGIASSLPGYFTQARETAGIAASVLHNARWSRPRSTLPRAKSSLRRLATTSLSLPDIDKVRRKHGGTVNDVVLSVLSGAFRDWLHSRGDQLQADTVRALIPVSQRARSRQGGSRRNELSGYLCDLPIGIRDPVLRLRAVRRAMDNNKSAGPWSGPGALPVLADHVPPWVHRVATPLAGRGAPLLFDTVISNVPLPPITLTLDEAPLTGIYPIAPLAAGQCLSISLLTYQDQVHIGVFADRRAVPDLDEFVEAIGQALDVLRDVETEPSVPEPRTRPHDHAHAHAIEGSIGGVDA